MAFVSCASNLSGCLMASARTTLMAENCVCHSPDRSPETTVRADLAGFGSGVRSLVSMYSLPDGCPGDGDAKPSADLARASSAVGVRSPACSLRAAALVARGLRGPAECCARAGDRSEPVGLSKPLRLWHGDTATTSAPC